ncbi:hypothetical protein [Thermoflavimicrobium dichotomicum]|uniref:Uncharacterized protein n=1 Tax=Thermoflavimicrobium dichotomicum TaxID=46223 RepID=A0A1I3URL4_9BACL|nr:hypothetical protein [Thermoflavimicrobium dichotomicum]SFJ85393.1 hypothetical protein SAMN05421852_12710 [Thermoflavimicrobium dichotomicum]
MSKPAELLKDLLVDTSPLTPEEREQIETSDGSYVTLEELKKDLGL